MASTTKKRLRRAAKRNERERRRALGLRPLRASQPEPPLGPDDLDGGGGVREPRRPRPNAPAGYFELDEPEPTFLELAR